MNALRNIACVVISHSPDAESEMVPLSPLPAEPKVVLTTDGGTDRVPHYPRGLVLEEVVVALEVIARAEEDLRLVEDDPLELRGGRELQPPQAPLDRVLRPPINDEPLRTLPILDFGNRKGPTDKGTPSEGRDLARWDQNRSPTSEQTGKGNPLL